MKPKRCPRCDSPSPERHPAVQFEGEVSLCPDPWHEPFDKLIQAEVAPSGPQEGQPIPAALKQLLFRLTMDAADASGRLSHYNEEIADKLQASAQAVALYVSQHGFTDDPATLPVPAEPQEPALIRYMTERNGPKRDAAFLETYAQRILDGTSATWEIPSTVAGTIQTIATHLKESTSVQPEAPAERPICRDCRNVGIWHCAHPDECGQMQPRRAAERPLAPQEKAEAALALMTTWLGNSDGLMTEDVIEWHDALAKALGKPTWEEHNVAGTSGLPSTRGEGAIACRHCGHSQEMHNVPNGLGECYEDIGGMVCRCRTFEPTSPREEPKP